MVASFVELAYSSNWIAKSKIMPGAIQDKTMVWQSALGFQETISRAHQMDESLSNGYQSDPSWSGVNWSLDNTCQQYPYSRLHLFPETSKALHNEEATTFPDIDNIISYSRSFVPLGKTQRPNNQALLKTFNRRPDTHSRSVHLQ